MVPSSTSVAACATLFSTAVAGEKEGPVELCAPPNTLAAQFRMGFDWLGAVNPKRNNKGDKSSKQAKDRSDARLEIAQSRLVGLCDRFRCSALVFNVTCQLFRTSEKFKFFPFSAPLIPIAVACLLKAPRRGLQGLAFGDLSTGTGVDKKTLGKAHRKLTTEIDKQTRTDDGCEACTTLHSPPEPIKVLYVKRYTRALGLQ
ncbi:hypothetical protein FRB93_007356 [Tulasnella sp. JGI-2019a]|nr:hypothetical protein FRB93_007356 [Tulasnella sp. JGI-2019a]